jgi:RimJ/RimL family protein N-acetyltransferase
MNPFTLEGRHIRLEPLGEQHVDGLAAASAGDPALYQWSPVPRGEAEVRRYIDTAIGLNKAGSAVPFAIIRLSDGEVVGSTRFWNLEHWLWPPGHAMNGAHAVDAINTEAKFLMLSHAFETWRALRVCLHTDARNLRSRAAMERLGASYEGTLRAHRLAADFTARDSLRFSFLAEEWPAIKQKLENHVNRE